MIRKILAVALLAATGSALANDGLLDSTFGVFSSGQNLIAIDQGGLNNDLLAKTLVSADGSIFLIGTSGTSGTDTNFSITKLTPSGQLVPSFGNNGTLLSLQTKLRATSASFDGSGNIVVAGSIGFSGTDRDFIVCRYTQQGQPVVFSGTGTTCRSIAFDFAGGNKTDIANDVIVDPNGKIVLAGEAGISVDQMYGATARLNSDGSLDSGFSAEGKQAYGFGTDKISRLNSIVRLSGGKYVVVGEFGNPGFVTGTNALFARLTIVGTLDPGYEGGAGFTDYAIDDGDAFNRNDTATKIVLQSDGSMFMAGTARSGAVSDNKSIGFVIKILPLDFANSDPSFASNGTRLLTDGYSTTLGDILVQSDGKVVIVASNRATTSIASKIEVIRLNAQGIFNTSTFGTSGRTYLDYNLAGGVDYGISGAFQNGHIIVGGYSLNTQPANFDLTVARLYNDLIFANGVD